MDPESSGDAPTVAAVKPAFLNGLTKEAGVEPFALVQNPAPRGLGAARRVVATFFFLAPPFVRSGAH